MTFRKTAKQKGAIKLISGNRSTMLFGGSRSGKSAIICFAVITRAIKHPNTMHLVLRRTAKSTKSSLWKKTFPDIMRMAYPGIWKYVNENKNETDREFIFPNGSRIILGGTGNIDEVEKLLGNEYSTIWFNECSEWVEYSIVETVLTRLSENKGCERRALYDMNPPASSHWTYKLCLDGVHPDTKATLSGISKVPYIRMNPVDNQENLPADYIEEMENSTGRRRQRYWLGEFMTDVEGALWTFEMVEDAKHLETSGDGKTVVAVDPATTSNKNSDETGIVVSCVTDCSKYRVLADYSGKMSPKQWATAAVRAYHEHDAECIVAEINQGGDMVKTIIHDIDSNVPVRTVHASKGKWARAEPISHLYEDGKVAHARGLDGLEDQMQTWVPKDSKGSPDRIDALVWGLTYLSKPSAIPVICF